MILFVEYIFNKRLECIEKARYVCNISISLHCIVRNGAAVPGHFVWLRENLGAVLELCPKNSKPSVKRSFLDFFMLDCGPLYYRLRPKEQASNTYTHSKNSS